MATGWRDEVGISSSRDPERGVEEKCAVWRAFMRLNEIEGIESSPKEAQSVSQRRLCYTPWLAFLGYPQGGRELIPLIPRWHWRAGARNRGAKVF